MKRIICSNRVLQKNVGGNSTYANNLYDKLTELGWKIEIKKMINSSKLMTLIQELNLGRADNVGLVHYPADTGPIYAKKIPTFTTVHGNASLHVSNIRSKVNNFVWNERVRLACKASTGIITVSENSKNDIVEAFQIDPKLIRVIYHGINHELFKPFVNDQELANAQSTLLKKYGIKGEYVLFLGNLEPRKNLETLIRATNLPSWPKHLKLIVVGRFAWGNREILNELSINERIHYLGFVPNNDVVSLLGTAKCLIFPSLYEGWGFPVLEALAVGCLVICSTTGALKESTQGNALYLEDPKSPKEIVELLNQILDSPSYCDSLKTSGKMFAKKFTWEKSAKEHERFFMEFCN